MVLIGASVYHSPDLPALPAVRANLSGLASVLTSPDLGGIPRDHCIVVVDPGDPRAIYAALRDAGRRAEDTLFVYYAGHGLLGPRLDELYLAATGSDLDDLRYSALSVDAIHDIFMDSRAHNRVLILDCCFSGRAIEHAMGRQDGLLQAKIKITGGITLASSPANWHALAPRGARYTAFTGALLDLLRDGIVGGPEVLTIGLIHERLSQILAARGLPEPQLGSTNTASQLGLVRNREYQGQEASDMSATTDRPHRAVQDASRPAHVEARFTQRPGRGWFDRAVWRASSWGPLVALVASWHVMSAGLRPILAVPYGVFSAAVLAAVTIPYPTRYELALDHEGIELIVGSQRTRYPWHRVKEARLVTYSSRTRRPCRVLSLELEPGTLPPDSHFLAPGPRWDESVSGLRFAELARLVADENDVERALGRFAIGCWKPAQDINLTGDAREFRIRRPRLIAGAIALIALGLCPLLIFGGLLRASIPITTLVFAAAWSGVVSIPGLIVASWASHSGHLKLDDEGIEVALGGRASRVAWHDVEQVRSTGWLPEMAGDRLLAVRLWPSSALPSAHVSLPWAYSRTHTLILCPVQIFSLGREDLLEGLTRFAGSAWKPDAGLYAPPGETAGRTRFTGRLMGPRTLIGAAAGYIAERLFLALIGLLTVPASAVSLAFPFSLTTMIVGLGFIAAGALFTRDRFSLVIDSNGLTLEIGRSSESMAWEDIDRISIVRSSHSTDGLVQTPWSSRSRSRSAKKNKKTVTKAIKDHEYLFAWLTSDAKIARRWWQVLGLMRPGLGGVSIMRLDAWPARVFATRAELEQALSRYGGSRFVSDQDTAMGDPVS